MTDKEVKQEAAAVQPPGDETPAPGGSTPEELAQQLQDRLQEMETGLKGEQRAGVRKSEEIQQLKEQLDSLRSDKELTQSLIAVMAQQQGKSEEELTEGIKADKPNLLQQYQTITRQQEAQRKVNSFQRRTEALGLTEDSDDFWAIRDAVEAGKYDRAESKLKKLEKAKAETPEGEPEPPKETEEEKATKHKKEIDEAARKMLEEKGLLTTEIGGPSGSSIAPTNEELDRMTPDEYAKWRKGKK